MRAHARVQDAPVLHAELHAELRAEAEFSPAQVAVGEPVELVVRLHHAPADSFELSSLGFDYSWVVLDRAGSVTTSDAAGTHTTYRWTLIPLEAGGGKLQALIFRDSTGTAAQVVFDSIPTLGVAGVLGTTEDAPRPIVGFLDPAPADSSLPWAWGLVPLALLLALAWWLLRRRSQRVPPSAPRPTPIERLAVLETRDLSEAGEPGFAADLHVELTGLVREHFDLAAGTQRLSLTDDEWLAAVALELDEGQRVALHALLLESREVKYGGATPTHWALQESLAAARAVLSSPLRTALAEASA